MTKPTILSPLFLTAHKTFSTFPISTCPNFAPNDRPYLFFLRPTPQLTQNDIPSPGKVKVFYNRCANIAAKDIPPASEADEPKPPEKGTVPAQ